MEIKDRYQMRRAAGLYWLIDMEQNGVCWREPVAVNESGAYIWAQYRRLGSEEAVAEELSRERGRLHRSRWRMSGASCSSSGSRE